MNSRSLLITSSVIDLLKKFIEAGVKYLKHSPSMPERPHISTSAITGKIIRLRWVGNAVSGVKSSLLSAMYHPQCQFLALTTHQSFLKGRHMVEALCLISAKNGITTYLKKLS